MQSTDYCRGSYRYNNNGYVRIIRATIHIPLNIRTYTIYINSYRMPKSKKVNKQAATTRSARANEHVGRNTICYNVFAFFSLSLMSANIPVAVYSTLFCWVKLWIGVRHYWRIALRCHCM